MNKEIIKYLEYLKREEYLYDYDIVDNYVLLRYGLFSCEDTERSIKVDKNSNITTFLNEILHSASQINNDIMATLVDDNDFYGYENMQELNARIDEEEYFLKSIVDAYKYMTEEMGY